MDLSSLHPALIATNLEKSLESFSDESEWEKLGEGGFSTVYKAKFKEQHIPVALKTLKRCVLIFICINLYSACYTTVSLYMLYSKYNSNLNFNLIFHCNYIF